jgi:hypothetical protein
MSGVKGREGLLGRERFTPAGDVSESLRRTGTHALTTTGMITDKVPLSFHLSTGGDPA